MFLDYWGGDIGRFLSAGLASDGSVMHFISSVLNAAYLHAWVPIGIAVAVIGHAYRILFRRGGVVDRTSEGVFDGSVTTDDVR